MAKVIKIRVTKPQMEKICERIAEGESLTRICNNTKSLPSWRTVLRWVQENDEAHTLYRRARALQCEVMRDQILDLVKLALPDDPKLAMAEVQRRRLECDHKYCMTVISHTNQQQYNKSHSINCDRCDI